MVHYKYILAFILFILGDSVISQIPSGYYNNADNKTCAELKTALYDIIKGHTEFPYTSSSTDTWDILKDADRDPNNSSNVIGIYSAFSIDGAAEFNGGNGWTREHVWAKSRGDFGTDNGPGTDCHHLRAEDGSTNSARSNRNFDECSTQYIDGTGPTDSFTSSAEFVWKPRTEVIGDVARMLFYMSARYEGENGEPDLELTEVLQTLTSKEPLHARLSTLLQWHEEDPVSQEEQDRNDIIYGFQNNRNPFIDHPEYVNLIWGDVCDVVAGINKRPAINVFPNPASTSFKVHVVETSLVELIDAYGRTILKKEGIGDIEIKTLGIKDGIYFIIVNHEEPTKLVIHHD